MPLGMMMLRMSLINACFRILSCSVVEVREGEALISTSQGFNVESIIISYLTYTTQGAQEARVPFKVVDWIRIPLFLPCLLTYP